MVTISIQTEEEILNALKEIAKQKQSTVEEVTEEALQQYLQRHVSPARSYSFVGIGHSGKGNISSRVEETLNQAANRREGWSLPE
jgi:hypothetical protein